MAAEKKMSKFQIIIASLPDRERVVAEIYYNNMHWAEISQEGKEPLIQFYPHPHEKWWEFSYAEAIQVLEQAKNKLFKGSCNDPIWI